MLLQRAQLQEKAGDVAQLVNSLSWEERYQWVTIHKTQGNQFFKEGEYKRAYDVYMRGMMGLDISSSQAPERLSRMKMELQYPLTMNIGQCEFRQGHYESASKLFLMALQIDSRFKALYMLAKSSLKLGHSAQAIDYYKRAQQKATGKEKEFLKELSTLLNESQS